MPGAHPPSCPRCGYDLTGVVTSWAESCPLEGVCSECGLGFLWHDVVRADTLVVDGFVEHAVGFRQRFRWSWRTWGWTLWPARFWRRVGITSPPRIGAILLWPALSLLLVGAVIPLLENLSLLVYMTAGFRKWNAVPGNWAFFAGPWTVGLARPGGSPATLVWDPREPSPLYVPGLALGLTIPFVLMCLPWTRKDAKVRPRHLLRASVFGLAWLAIPSICAFPSTLASAITNIVCGLGGASLARNLVSNGLLYLGGWMYQYWAVFFALVAVWTVVWWGTAINTLFTGHHPRRVFAVVLLPSVLAVAVALMYSDQFRWVMRLWV